MIRGWVALGFASLALGACGGDTEESNGSGGTSSGGSAGTGTGGSGGSISGGSGGSVTGGSGGTPSGGTGGTATGGSGGATGGSAGVAGGGSVTCGDKTCASGEYCCEPDCVANGSACSGFALHCDDATDCPGAFCCAGPGATGTFPIVAECNSSCDADTQMIVCKYTDPNGCPSGMKCQITAKLPPAYGYCA